MSKYRKKMSRKRSKKLFTKTAAHVNRKNVVSSPMRGGIRM